MIKSIVIRRSTGAVNCHVVCRKRDNDGHDIRTRVYRNPTSASLWRITSLTVAYKPNNDPDTRAYSGTTWAGIARRVAR